MSIYKQKPDSYLDFNDSVFIVIIVKGSLIIAKFSLVTDIE